MADRLLVDLDGSGQVTVITWPEGELPEIVSQAQLEWPLDARMLEDLRWYLEDYLRAPFGVWENRGPQIQARLADWGNAVFASLFGSGAARDLYQRVRDRQLELVFRSASPALLGLPWELMRDSSGPVALGLAGVSRALPVAELTQTAVIPGGRLRVLMVISRPAGTGDVGYRMIGRPLLERLNAVRGHVDLVVLRPPTLNALHDALAEAVAAGRPFHIVHFDGHGALPGRDAGAGGLGRRPGMMASQAREGVLAFEGPSGGVDAVPASRLASVLKNAGVPVVVLNACQSGAVGKDVEAAVATRLLREGCAAVVAMAYSVYAVAAAEFMAVFYERLLAGDSISAATTAGRRRLFEKDGRPSPKGELPLADWMVPVHYLRQEVSFPEARTTRSPQEPPLEAMLDDLRASSVGRPNQAESLDAVGVFIGRDDLFLQLEAAIRLQHVVVLHGPGGTGKTELAKAFGRWWRDTGGVERPDWVLWHSFEPGVASFGLEGVITEIGLTVFGSDFVRLDSEERSRTVERLLAERRLLLIWDNFESVYSMPDPAGTTGSVDETGRHHIRDFLIRLYANGKSAVVITSRTAEDWLGTVRRIEIGGLTREEAAQYAMDLLVPYPAAVQRRKQREFGELLEWLDGHPLSMRLILPRLDFSEPEALIGGLRGTTVLPGGEAGEDRRTSLAASITYSFTHLTGQTRRLLPAVGLFHIIADVDVLTSFSSAPGVPARFAKVSGQQWTQALEDAGRVGLLTSLGGGMYRIHPALPSYMAALWDHEEPGDETLHGAAAEAMCSAVAGFSAWLDEEIGSGHAAGAYALVGLHRHTLGAFLSYALDSRQWMQSQAIGQPLSRYWAARGLDQESDAWADKVRLATEGLDGEPPSLGSDAGNLWLFFTGNQANRQRTQGHVDDAEHTYLRILAMLQIQSASPNQQRNIASTYEMLGNVAQQRRQLGEAENWYRKALAISEEIDDQQGAASAYDHLGTIAQESGRLDDAEEWYRKSRTITGENGERPTMARSYNQLGNVAQDRGHLDEAENWYRKALVISKEIGSRPAIASAFYNLGLVARMRERMDEAEDWYRKSLALREQLGNRPDLAVTYHGLGVVAQERGRLDEAQAWHRKSLAIKEQLSDRPGMATTYHELGMVAHGQERPDEAEDWYRMSLAITEELGDRSAMAGTYHQLGISAHDRGRLDEAEAWHRKSLAIKEQLSDRPGMATTYHELGMVAHGQERPDEAEAWHRKSLAIKEQLSNRPGMARSYDQLAIVADDRGRLDEAQEWHRKALAIKEQLGNRRDMVTTLQRLGLLAEKRDQLPEALEWTVKSVVLCAQISHPASRLDSARLARLIAQLGRLAAQIGSADLEACWRKITENPLPQDIRDYVDSLASSGDA